MRGNRLNRDEEGGREENERKRGWGEEDKSTKAVCQASPQVTDSQSIDA